MKLNFFLILCITFSFSNAQIDRKNYPNIPWNAVTSKNDTIERVCKESNILYPYKVKNAQKAHKRGNATSNDYAILSEYSKLKRKIYNLKEPNKPKPKIKITPQVQELVSYFKKYIGYFVYDNERIIIDELEVTGDGFSIKLKSQKKKTVTINLQKIDNSSLKGGKVYNPETKKFSYFNLKFSGTNSITVNDNTKYFLGELHFVNTVLIPFKASTYSEDVIYKVQDLIYKISL